MPELMPREFSLGDLAVLEADEQVSHAEAQVGEALALARTRRTLEVDEEVGHLWVWCVMRGIERNVGEGEGEGEGDRSVGCGEDGQSPQSGDIHVSTC
jgi:hypothetical protein